MDEKAKKYQIRTEQLFNWIEKNRIINLKQVRASIYERFKSENYFVAFVEKPKRSTLKRLRPLDSCGICIHYMTRQVSFATNQATDVSKCFLFKEWLIGVFLYKHCDSFSLNKKEVERLLG